MRKSASPRSAALPACRSRAAEKAQRQNDQSDTADRRAAETAYSCLSGTVPRMSASIDRTERPIGNAVRPLPKRRPNSLSPHDRNVQERPRPDRRTETSAPRSERPCDLGSEKPAQSPCENSLRLFPNRSRFSHLPGLNPFRRTSDFSGRTPSENTDRRSSPTQTGNLTDGPSERYDPVP